MKTSLKRILTVCVLFLFVFAAGCGTSNTSLPEGDISFQEGMLNVAFLDVGQGDSILLKSPDGKIMLIDAGEATEEDVIQAALKSNGIKKIDYLVATHPHSDHIGSMPAIVEDYEIGEIYMPRAASNTKTYEQLLENIQDKGLTVHAGRAGVTLEFGTQVTGEFLAPISEGYEETNNESLVLKLTYGETSFLFTGDAESLSEGEMLENAPDKLDVDVLKVGHHGSSSSSSMDFLLAVSPEYAVISCGKDNSYGHPHAETTYNLKQLGITTFRTDLLGTILAVSDGETITFNREGQPGDDIPAIATSPAPAPSSELLPTPTPIPSASLSPESTPEPPSPTPSPSETSLPSADESLSPTPGEQEGEIVYITKTGKSYHKANCSSLRKSKIEITLEEAEEKGYKPCGRCYK